MKIYFILFSILLSLLNCAKITSDTDKPKLFLSDDALEFDLIGNVTKVDCIMIDSLATGNNAELYQGYYKGVIDSITLEYNTEIKLLTSTVVRRSIQTYKEDKNKKIFFTNEQIPLYRYDSIRNQDISQSNYRQLIKNNKLIDTLLSHRLYYNKNGDIKEAEGLDKDYFKRTKQTEKLMYQYKYDNVGNWTERIITGVADDKKYISQIDYRKITYRPE